MTSSDPEEISASELLLYVLVEEPRGVTAASLLPSASRGELLGEGVDFPEDLGLGSFPELLLEELLEEDDIS